MGSKMDTSGGVFDDIFKFLWKNANCVFDRAGAIGLDFTSPVFVVLASWQALAARLFPRTIPKDTGNSNDLE